MKILFICDYFPPFDKGGGEISTYWQAQQLKKNGVKVVVLAPKFNGRTIFLNPFFTFYLFQKILKVYKKEKFNLIHCQGKYSAQAAVFAKYILEIPLIITLRDYGGICNHGFCLWKEKKACTLISFIKKDFWFYYQNYLRVKNIFSFVRQLLFSCLGRINTLILSFFMKKADKFICVSNFIKSIYSINGYDKNKMTTIYNIYPIKIGDKTKLSKKITPLLRKFKYRVIYAGKLSLGKGADLLIKSAQKIAEVRKDILFIFAGKIVFPIKKYKHSQMVFLGQLSNQQILKLIFSSSLVCIPSVWPEPLSRVIIEAAYLNKPVLSSNRGGQPELISQKTGWLFEPTIKGLNCVLTQVIKEKNQWQIKGEAARIRILRYEQETIKQLINLYQSLL